MQTSANVSRRTAFTDRYVRYDCGCLRIYLADVAGRTGSAQSAVRPRPYLRLLECGVPWAECRIRATGTITAVHALYTHSIVVFFLDLTAVITVRNDSGTWVQVTCDAIASAIKLHAY